MIEYTRGNIPKGLKKAAQYEWPEGAYYVAVYGGEKVHFVDDCDRGPMCLHEFSKGQHAAARQALGLDTWVSTEDEEECIKLAEARINNADKYSKYYKDVRHLDSVDVYRVLSLFDCDRHGHAIGHAAKKLLLSGERTGRKSVEDDVREAIDTLKRWLEMREEDSREV